jgi:hypothetical protein
MAPFSVRDLVERLIEAEVSSVGVVGDRGIDFETEEAEMLPLPRETNVCLPFYISLVVVLPTHAYKTGRLIALCRSGASNVRPTLAASYATNGE